MNYTNIEQSKKLLELGLNPESADMYYMGPGDIDSGEYTISENTAIVEIGNGYKYRGTLPCWSLGALLEAMPDRIWGPDDDYDEGPCAHELVFKSFGRTLEYKGILTSDYRLSGAWFKQETDNLIDIFYNMVVWLLENGYIKKESDN